MKIIHVSTVHDYKDTRIYYRYCKVLAQKGYDVSFFCTGVSNTIESGVKLVSLGNRRGLVLRLLLNFPIVIFKALFARPDIIHIHDPELLLIAPLLRLMCHKVVYDVHEDNYQNILQKKSVSSLMRKPLALLVAAIEKVSCSYCFIVIAEKYYRSRFPAAIEALNYPLSDYSNSLDDDVSVLSEQVKSELPSSFDSRYSWFLYTGNVTEERGAITQLDLLCASERYAIFYVGKCSKEVYAKIISFLVENGINKERVHVFGVEFHVPQSVIEYYQKNFTWLAGLAIFPHSEFYVNKELTKFFEYYRHGIPILCSNTPVWHKFLYDNNAGVVYAPGWESEISRQMSLMHSNNRLKFTWESQLSRVVELVYCS